MSNAELLITTTMNASRDLSLKDW